MQLTLTWRKLGKRSFRLCRIFFSLNGWFARFLQLTTVLPIIINNNNKHPLITKNNNNKLENINFCEREKNSNNFFSRLLHEKKIYFKFSLNFFLIKVGGFCSSPIRACCAIINFMLFVFPLIFFAQVCFCKYLSFILDVLLT